MKKSLVVAILILSSFQVIAAEIYLKPAEIVEHRFAQLLDEKNFSLIEKSIEDARKTESVTEEGLPVLNSIYAGVAGCPEPDCKSKLFSDYWERKKRLLTEWKNKYPKSTAPLIAEALYHSMLAWNIRGSGYANTVSEEQWKAFRENINTARSLLESMPKKARNDPAWHAALLYQMMSQGEENEIFDRAFEEAVSKFPTYIPIYFAGSSYYSPRWHGSIPELKKFIEQSVARTQSKLGNTLYARLNWNVQTRSMFSDGQVNWVLMRSGFERIAKEYPDPWNMNNFAKFSCLASDAKILPVVMKRIEGKIIMRGWDNWKNLFDMCKKLADDVDPDFYDNVDF